MYSHIFTYVLLPIALFMFFFGYYGLAFKQKVDLVKMLLSMLLSIAVINVIVLVTRFISSS